MGEAQSGGGEERPYEDSTIAKAPEIVARWKGAGELGAFDVGRRPKSRTWLLRRVPRNDDERKAQGQDDLVGVLPLGKVGLLASAGGVGKTMALCQLAISVATGRPWFGPDGWHVPLEGQGRSLLLLGEEDEDEAHRRLYDAAEALGLTDQERALCSARIDVIPLAGVASALTHSAKGETVDTAALEALRRGLADRAGPEGWRLVVVDPLSRFADADAEIDNSAATRFVQAIESLAKVNGEGRTGPAVLVTHHTSKGSRKDGDASGNAIRGATALIDGVRWGATLEVLTPIVEDEPGFECVRVANVKSNYSAMAPPLYLRRGAFGRLATMSEGEREKFVRPPGKGGANGRAPGKGAAANGNPAAHYHDPDDDAATSNGHGRQHDGGYYAQKLGL